MAKHILVDSNVILDLFTDDPKWYTWSKDILQEHCLNHILCINPIIYTEISTGFNKIEKLEIALKECQFKFLEIPREALFLAGKVFVQYRKNKGTKISSLPDFFIAAHASILNIPLITRDLKRICYYFPKLEVIAPCPEPAY